MLEDETERIHGKVTRAINKFAERVGQAKSLNADKARLTEEASQAAADALTAEKAGALLLKHSEVRTEAVKARYEGLSTQGLEAIFGPDHAVELVADTKAGRSEAEFVVSSGGITTSVMSSRGGGLAAALGFVLRAATVLSIPGMRPLMILDESFAQVSQGYEAPLAEFIDELCRKSGLQVVLVTHSQEDVWRELATKAYVSKQVNGKTSFTAVK